jgi:hypothetical protein
MAAAGSGWGDGQAGPGLHPPRCYRRADGSAAMPNAHDRMRVRRPGPRQGVSATPSEPWDGAVTVAGDRGVILPVTGLILNCDRAPLPSLVT